YLVREGGADMLKLDAAAGFPEATRAVIETGIPVWAQFGITPHTAARYAAKAKTLSELAAELKDQFVLEADMLEGAGASLLDFTNSGPVAGPAVTATVSIPVLGGLGGGPWLDGRVRAVMNAIGYTASSLEDNSERYASVAQIALDAIKTYADDVRTGRKVRGK
ncbi:MAG: 3-methyl-2-oxobutanoate hydroxymethyltransferase, partial [Acidobacteria bacterium]|nr:3-methyl-2-oxobutanoate hydroxymethyltransferase [Acidobacteriota bacterium]